jgi:hypothetical protein
MYVNKNIDFNSINDNINILNYKKIKFWFYYKFLFIDYWSELLNQNFKFNLKKKKKINFEKIIFEKYILYLWLIR